MRMWVSQRKRWEKLLVISLLDECESVGVPFFFIAHALQVQKMENSDQGKQLRWPPTPSREDYEDYTQNVFALRINRFIEPAQ